MPPPRLRSTIPGSETSSHTLCSVGKWGVLGLSHIRRLPLIGFLTHGPEPLQRLCGNARAKKGNIALQVGADEILAPLQAVRVVGCKVTLGKSPANPEPAGVAGDFPRVTLPPTTRTA